MPYISHFGFRDAAFYHASKADARLSDYDFGRLWASAFSVPAPMFTI